VTAETDAAADHLSALLAVVVNLADEDHNDGAVRAGLELRARGDRSMIDRHRWMRPIR
jgi:hypothetical protein